MTWQPARILYPDVELWAVGYMDAALKSRGEPVAAAVWVGNTRPAKEVFTRLGRPYPKRMVVFRRDGGQPGELRDNARVSMRCWAETDKDATDLARLANALLIAAPDGRPVLSVRQESGPTPIPDDAGPQRYSLFTIATRGEQLA